LGFGDKAQAILVSISAAFISVGTAAEAIPSSLAPETKATLFIVFWIAGIVGLAIKEAAGGQPKTASTGP
jgi:hypothetical protein